MRYSSEEAEAEVLEPQGMREAVKNLLSAEQICLGNYLSNFTTPSTSPTVAAA